jgi:hypothetical protein
MPFTGLSIPAEVVESDEFCEKAKPGTRAVSSSAIRVERTTLRHVALHFRGMNPPGTGPSQMLAELLREDEHIKIKASTGR